MQQVNSKFLTVLALLFGLSALYAEPVRIMPLGDSITAGYMGVLGDDFANVDTSMVSGYRNYLWYSLENAGYEADFVGSLITGERVEPPFDTEHEGYYGWTCHDIANITYDRLMQNPADIVLLHIGTNDMGVSTDGVNLILNEIDRFERDTGIHVKVYVAMIIDFRSASAYIRYFNEDLMKLVGNRIRLGDDLMLVNMYTGAGLTASDYSDPVHPNDSGYGKMASVWLNAITGPETTGLYAYPYAHVEASYIIPGSIEVDQAGAVVAFTTAIPDTGIVF